MAQPNVAGIILAGSADFKTELSQSDLFDIRLQAVIVNVVDVSYGGENGFNQAIELSADILANVKFIKEKKLIAKYFDEISQDTGKYCFGVDDTLTCLDMGAVETLIVWENLDVNRHVLINHTTNETIVKHFTPEQENDTSNFVDKATGVELESQEKISLLEWFANEYKRFGCQLEFVTNRSQEGSQFCRGFGKPLKKTNLCSYCFPAGGIGGCLRYQVNLGEFHNASDDEECVPMRHPGTRAEKLAFPLIFPADARPPKLPVAANFMRCAAKCFFVLRGTQPTIPIPGRIRRLRLNALKWRYSSCVAGENVPLFREWVFIRCS